MDQDGTWHGGRPGSRPHCAKWGPSYPPQKGTEPPNFRSISIVAKRLDASIKMPLGMEVGLSPGDFIRWGPSCLSPKGGRKTPPIFGPCLLRPNGYMYQDTTWYGGRPQPRRHCVRWGPMQLSLPYKGTAPNFRRMSVVAKRLDGSRCHLVRR